MEIQHSDDGKKGRFYVEIDGKKLAEMTYVWSSETKFIIDHTEVDDKLRGKNVGKQLVHAAVEFAREKNSKILPLCPFAKAIFNKIDEYKDVLV